MEEDPTTATGVVQVEDSLDDDDDDVNLEGGGVPGMQGSSIVSPLPIAPRFGSGAVGRGLPGKEPVEEKLGDLLARLVSPGTLRFRSGFSKGPNEPVVQDGDVEAGTSRQSGENTRVDSVSKVSLADLGPRVLQVLLEVLPLRSQPMVGGKAIGLFPLPTSQECLKDFFGVHDQHLFSWLGCLCIGLNCLWGDESYFCNVPPKGFKKELVFDLAEEVRRMSLIKVDAGTDFDWDVFFRTRSVDYQGDEVKVARSFSWSNISPALPKEVGRVPLTDVCELGTKYYVDNIDLYLKPVSEWKPLTYPKVMVADDDWGEVCEGLVSSGICTFLCEEEVYSTDSGLLLNGLFGVTKDEWKDGTEIFRLIMNLIPFNSIAQPLSGDIATLPGWAQMSSFFIQPTENLLISSEDVRCFFYIMSVPCAWQKFLAFNKLVPQSVLPDTLKGKRIYLASRVLPMGFLNSVSLAQHVHRNLVRASKLPKFGPAAMPEREIRKDRPLPVADTSWRVYLDNFDLLEKVRDDKGSDLVGSTAPGVLALREVYEHWDVPRNAKKGVARSLKAEVQGAQVDGALGVAYPRDPKLFKYIQAALKLLDEKRVSQRQMQVVCGGLVYISMFRRALLGSLNQVWKFIESFGEGHRLLPIPPECRLEIGRFVSLVPLARLDFRLQVEGQVTCSDASTTGGGACASAGLSPFGSLACEGAIRGRHPEDHYDRKVLSVGLFDGIGALRVALDLLNADVIGHISVEVSSQASRVVESHFPNVIFVDNVESVDAALVQQWSGRFDQVSLVLLGAGPPCQGVSGLNAERKGALRDLRSCLFVHVPRIKALFAKYFPWCQVHALMESVASMDEADRLTMSREFGDTPWRCDAGTLTWCSRPRLYWVTWEISDEEEQVVFSQDSEVREVILYGEQSLFDVCQEGWIKVDPTRPFPTFTTSRPRDKAGYKPAGVHQCSGEDLDRWVTDKYRYPPYQYMSKNCLINKRNELRLPSIEEKEYLMGFPVNYTQLCVPKQERRGDRYLDTRHSLLGNTWSVPVVAWFISQLLAPRGLCQAHPPQAIIDKLNAGNCVDLQARLLRIPLRPIRGLGGKGDEQQLSFKLSNLVSVKGEDIMLTASTQEQVKFHRLRASVPGRLWKWKIVTGWKWKGSPEHINVLEMRAILTTIRWRIEKKQMRKKRFIHLTDSLVCLHALSRGRSSSRKLRRTICRINALLLVSGCQPFWGYIHTDQNPADKPSRWGSNIRTKFRNA